MGRKPVTFSIIYIGGEGQLLTEKGLTEERAKELYTRAPKSIVWRGGEEVPAKAEEIPATTVVTFGGDKKTRRPRTTPTEPKKRGRKAKETAPVNGTQAGVGTGA